MYEYQHWMKDKKTLKKGKNSAAMKISDIWIGLDGVEKVEVGELLGENTSVTTFSIRHRCHTHHLLSHSAQQILEFLHRQILKINKTQNSKIRILLGIIRIWILIAGLLLAWLSFIRIIQPWINQRSWTHCHISIYQRSWRNNRHVS